MSGDASRNETAGELEERPARPDGGSAAAAAPDRRRGRRARVWNAAGKWTNTAVLVLVVLFLGGPILLTLVASFAENWQGVLPYDWVGVVPTGFTLRNWYAALGVGEQVGVQRGVGRGLLFSVGLATGGMLINVVIGVPIAYALTRYDFYLRDWLNAVAVLPLVPGLILGVAFLRTYPENAGSAASLIVGYSLLKAPWLILTVQSAFQSMDLRRLEESARALGASWPRAFLSVVVPNARNGIVAGAIITWTLAAAEFNFTYVVYTRGPRPFALFLFSNVNNAPFLQAAAAVSIYFLIVAAAILVLQVAGQTGFSTARDGS